MLFLLLLLLTFLNDCLTQSYAQQPKLCLGVLYQVDHGFDSRDTRARGHRLTFLLQGEMVALKAGRLGLLTTKDTRWDSYYQDGKSQQPLISSYWLCENTQDLIVKMSRKGI